MKKHFIAQAILASLFVGAILFPSCKKDSIHIVEPSENPPNESHSDGELEFRDGGSGLYDRLVVLGQQINNPYSVANMTQAWNNLYQPDVPVLPATHLYVRFLPENMEELKVLDDLDLDFDDFPLDYQVVKEGDYYHDPSIPADKPTWLYTVVETDFTPPSGIQYEVLEDLVLSPYYSHLTSEAYRISGNDYDRSGWNDPEAAACEPSCPAYPFCLDEVKNCYDTNLSHLAPCSPDSPRWPDCLEEDTRAPDTMIIRNECGCEVYFDPKRPGGCVNVVDTQLNPEPGVRQVKVVVKDGLFQRKVTYTDENGCWKINKKHSGKVKIKIKFKNDKAKVRAIRQWVYLWQYGKILTHIEVKDDPPYNHWNTLFGTDADDGSKKRSLWYAATANNAVFEFNEFATADGIALPPETLDILLTKANSGDAAAPMFDEMTANPLIFAGGILGLNGLAAVVGIFSPDPTNLQSIMTVLAPYLVIWAPDIVYNHGEQGIETSDDAKETFYHEYGHAAHWNALNDNNYWLANALHIATHGGYGDGNDNGSERTAVIEMWGSHIGLTYADQQYGTNHSNTASTNPLTIEAERHIYILERDFPNPASPNPDLWIPEGVFRDCIDDNSLNPVNVTDGVISDVFSGFTQLQCFQAISNSPTSVQQVRNFLTTNFLPAGVSAASVNTLFLEYGF